MISFPNFYVTLARAKDLKIMITRLLSVATAGVYTEQQADINPHYFTRIIVHGLYI